MSGLVAYNIPLLSAVHPNLSPKSAYFIRVTKDVSLARQRHQQDLPPQTGTDGQEEGGQHDRDQERAVLLREVVPLGLG